MLFSHESDADSEFNIPYIDLINWICIVLMLIYSFWYYNNNIINNNKEGIVRRNELSSSVFVEVNVVV